MLSFQKTRLVFLIAFAIALLEFFILKFPWYYLLQLPILYSLVLAYGSAFIGSGFFMKSICKATTNEKIMALSFDDGPDPINTPLILDILKQHEIKASFFIIGKKISTNESLLLRIKNEGHLIGNHSFSHSYFFDFYPTQKVTDDLNQSTTTIRKITGLTPKWFRPPYGVTNPNIARAMRQLQMVSIGWNVRSLDTVIQDTDKLYKRVISRITPGSILLFHDTGSNTVETLKAVILFAQKNSYRIVGLDEMLNIKAYEQI
jgi:peptidoglycan/xylan/chitin deacetylase (PgdA/CDA1 family)